MATKRIETGPTPNGGVRVEFYFKDARGEPADEKVASDVEAVEYDASGGVILRTHAKLGIRGAEGKSYGQR